MLPCDHPIPVCSQPCPQRSPKTHKEDCTSELSSYIISFHYFFLYCAEFLYGRGGFFVFICFLSELQLNFMSGNHSTDLVVLLVIGCNEDCADEFLLLVIHTQLQNLWQLSPLPSSSLYYSFTQKQPPRAQLYHSFKNRLYLCCVTCMTASQSFGCTTGQL